MKISPPRPATPEASLRWSDKGPSASTPSRPASGSVRIADKFRSHALAMPTRGSWRGSIKAGADKPPPRPRRPDSTDLVVADLADPIVLPVISSAEAGNNTAPPSKTGRSSPATSLWPDLEVQLDEIVSTYTSTPAAADDEAPVADVSPSASTAEPDTSRGSPSTTGSPQQPASPKPSSPSSASTARDVDAQFANFKLPGPGEKAPPFMLKPSSKRARTLVPLGSRTTHLASTPGYADRLELLEKLEVAMDAFLRIEDAESILLVEKIPEGPVNSLSARRRSRESVLHRVRSSWRGSSATPAPRTPGPVFGVAVSRIPQDAFVEATLAGRPYELPLVCFASMEETYRRGQGSAVKLFLVAPGDPRRREQLQSVYEEAPEFGADHDLSLESVHDSSALLKDFLASLPAPLVDEHIGRLFLTACVDSARPREDKIDCAQLILRLLPKRHFNLLVYLVAGFSQFPLFKHNAVSLEQVASLYGPAIFAPRAVKSNRRMSPMSISGPTDSGSSRSKLEKSGAAALRWLLVHWSPIARQLLAHTRPDLVRTVSSETLLISKNLVEKSDAPATGTGATSEPCTPRTAPPLSPSPSTSSSQCESLHTPSEGGSLKTEADETDEAQAELQKQLDEAIASFSIRRPSADDADGLSSRSCGLPSTPTIPEDETFPPTPPEVPAKSDLPGRPEARCHSPRTSLARDGVKNLLLPTHVRRYDEIVSLRQKLAAVERERAAERADLDRLRRQVEEFQNRAAVAPTSE
ncbi:Type II inositol 1,4,5-trisphosphate 5-phosphatase [Rhodotorula sphaerocarpa]